MGFRVSDSKAKVHLIEPQIQSGAESGALLHFILSIGHFRRDFSALLHYNVSSPIYVVNADAARRFSF
jgi:hypothetical protein